MNRKPRTDEFKKKLSDRMKGNTYRKGTILDEEYRKKVSEGVKRAWANGKIRNRRKCPVELINHQYRGKSLPNEIKLKLSVALSGTKNPNWQGWKSKEPYCVNWDEVFKEFIKERDQYKCQNPHCTRKHTKIFVHHIDYIKKNCTPQNCISVCTSCNSRANFNRNAWQSLYQLILNRKHGYEYGEINA